MGWVEEEEMIWCCLINVSNDWFLVFIFIPFQESMSDVAYERPTIDFHL